MSQRTSAPQPWFVGVGTGTGSAPGPRVQLFAGGSISGVTVTVLPTTVRTAAFHVPETKFGRWPMPPYCQSPANGFGLLASVTNIAGNIGRSDVSTPPWASVAPVAGLNALSGSIVRGETG